MPATTGDVVVTGIGAISSLGEDCGALWAAIETGRSGIGPIRRFSTEGFRVHMGATVERWAGPAEAGPELTESLCRIFAETAAREALCHAGDGAAFEGPRIAMVFGTSIADLQERVHTFAEEIADALRLLGPRITVSTACSSSTAAIGFGRELIASGIAEAVIAGGADVLTPEVFAGFHALGVLSPTRCAPFSMPPGMSLGEGAGFLVLEQRDRAAARGAQAIATLAGFGLSGDGWHETSPDPKGGGVERAILGALADARLPPEFIGYVNAHGSGTEANDHSEWLGVRRALGRRAQEVPISSTKGALGHAQGAAGALEAIVTLMAAERGLVPPTLNFNGARLHGPPDTVGSDKPRPAVWDHALAINSAFGGSNAALLFSRVPREPVRRARHRVALLGVGVVTPNGSRPGRVERFSVSTEVPTADPRGLDPASTFLTAAAARALNDAGIAIRGSLRERTGLLVGQTRGSPTSIVQFQQSIAARGLQHLSAAAFARIVLNAPAGFCSKLLSLRGPLSAVSTGAGSGLTALLLGAGLLESRDDTDLLLVGACDEQYLENGTVPEHCDEGAACLVLGNERGLAHSHGGARVWIAGHGIAGPGLLDTAIAAAVRSSRVDPATVPVIRAEPERRGRATGALLAVVEVARMLGEGATTHALVTMDFGRSLCAAVLLEAPGATHAVDT